MVSALFAAVVAASARASPIIVKTDATWKATNPAPATGWNTDLSFDDSTWQSAFKSPAGDNIWLNSNSSGSAPNQVWFRYVFTLDQPVASALGDFFFDDNGENYLNGNPIITDTGGGATSFLATVLDPAFFVVGPNLFAIHGIDTHGPFNNVSANLQITLAPEPSSLSLLCVAAAIISRRSRSIPRPSH